METKYYPINEHAARIAHEMNSHRDYREGSNTAEYRAQVDECARIAADTLERLDNDEDRARVANLMDRYARKLAEWYNHKFAIESRCPSILVAGGGNFPVRKKEKQNAARDRHWQEWEELKKIPERIRAIGTGGIQSDDANAIKKLQKKLEALEQAQEVMKGVNAHYRKHGTLDGAPGLSAENIEKLKASMARSGRTDPKPFASFALANNSAEMRRVRARIEQLSKIKATGTAEQTVESIAGAVRVVENVEAMRIQLIFPDKPPAKVRDVLKANGFRWAPSAGAWQRQLTVNGKYAAKRVLREINA